MKSIDDIFAQIASQMEELEKSYQRLEKTKQLYEESRCHIPVTEDTYHILLFESYMDLIKKLHTFDSLDNHNLLLQMQINDLTSRIAKLEFEVAELKRRAA